MSGDLGLRAAGLGDAPEFAAQYWKSLQQENARIVAANASNTAQQVTNTAVAVGTRALLGTAVQNNPANIHSTTLAIARGQKWATCSALLQEVAAMFGYKLELQMPTAGPNGAREEHLTGRLLADVAAVSAAQLMAQPATAALTPAMGDAPAAKLPATAANAAALAAAAAAAALAPGSRAVQAAEGEAPSTTAVARAASTQQVKVGERRKRTNEEAARDSSRHMDASSSRAKPVAASNGSGLRITTSINDDSPSAGKRLRTVQASDRRMQRSSSEDEDDGVAARKASVFERLGRKGAGEGRGVTGAGIGAGDGRGKGPENGHMRRAETAAEAALAGVKAKDRVVVKEEQRAEAEHGSGTGRSGERGHSTFKDEGSGRGRGGGGSASVFSRLGGGGKEVKVKTDKKGGEGGRVMSRIMYTDAA